MTEQDAIKDISENIKPYVGGKSLDMVIKALEEIQQYRAIGTVEECREAVEKMKPKKTALEVHKVHICPVCGSSGIYDYCGNCGQRVQMLSE